MAAIKIKLVVDSSRNRVLFADAGSDFVDVLLSFLTLPLSALQLAAGTSTPGCLTNLCDSVHRLGDAKLVKVEACHGMLLRPTHTEEYGYSRPCCTRCTPFVKKHLTPQGRHSKSCRCWEVPMARLVHVYSETTTKQVFCNWKERFVISDDWVIKQASTSSVVSFLPGLDAHGVVTDGYEEMEVDVGWPEVVSLLKSCVSSTAIFTDVFLLKGTDQVVRPALAQRSLPMIPKPEHQETSDPTSSEPPAHILIKLFFDRQERKVLYAECKHEFVDLLLSFLTYPMGCIVKNLSGTPHLFGSFNNLYSSATGLDVAGFLSGPCFGGVKTLLAPSLAPFKLHSNGSEQGVAEWYYLCRTPGCNCGKENGSCHSFDPEFVENHTYVVEDDLHIYQASAVSVLKHWCKRDRDIVAEVDILISKQEAVALLRAVVNSKTALTDVFKGKLDQEEQRLPPPKRTCSSSVEQMQIFVKTLAGNTITLNVASSDTLAAVRSKIRTKGKLMEPYRLVYGGKCLQDPWTLADCGIHKEATIHAELGQPVR